LIDIPPHDGSEWGARVVILAALLVPPALLLLSWPGCATCNTFPDAAASPPT
jgi:hypothetical protein